MIKSVLGDNMKVLIATDSFKGSLSSLEAGTAASDGIRRVYPDAETEVLPVADGGEGTVDALVPGLNGKKEFIEATDPLGRKITCAYGIIGTNTAVIEMSAAAGITLLKESELNPLCTTTYGVGEIIKDAVNKGCRKFIIGIGGSATNDCGIGMLQALGFSFTDKAGKEVSFGAAGIKDIETINCDNVLPELKDCSFNIACDVNNPLCGEKGCSAVYAPQKGADKNMIKNMDIWLSDFADKAKIINPLSDKNYPGAGAAGGLGFAFLTFLKGRLISGIDLILEEIHIEEKIKDADFVITGEGRIDAQTLMGKAPGGIASIAKKYGKTVIGLAGAVTKDAVLCNGKGIDAFFPVLRGISTLEEALNKENAYSNTADAAEQIFRLIKAIDKG